MIKIAPSILSADFKNLEKEINKVEEAGADLIHIDIMDGHFVPNITIGPLIVKACRDVTNLPLDVHLMIENPDRYIPSFAKAGADIITIHVEASKNLDEDIALIRQNNVKPGVVINPPTPADKVFDILTKIAMVLVMSVNPGFEGQSFMPEILPKIKQLREEIKKRKLNVDIEVDGGINLKTASKAVNAGANVLVAGSAIFYDKEFPKILKYLKTL
ncbi:ribulose-phosphate 3-epimerase [candidate division WOR-1 bacterium RIFOXYA2_FULL_36_21]|uniref:Ribulose-phosphate 3-epimerase n=1 Tax=candidate division WOR-1 bacterium RIFOXYB2_FULL_36_35 TaxID=1802578 RepID=A0A1F4S1W9_UNCSA|nr:MAG: ribulose-phosphate 3-epimerase [candidate division WOR-1 bacterium RIFOXYA2_FULL_36_21]OGC14431.1 MAG: ribulose-phosphate 3-epimerase [candidate division WOR-1 bacterium RIFOXYB2_FULL_36_35]OGC19951.1 MAG: ribulose-phosphate 3-epimerase [candidate division WOR-1 bacterium RIFOXYA12_FULL_36_13]